MEERHTTTQFIWEVPIFLDRDPCTGYYKSESPFLNDIGGGETVRDAIADLLEINSTDVGGSLFLDGDHFGESLSPGELADILVAVGPLKWSDQPEEPPTENHLPTLD